MKVVDATFFPCVTCQAPLIDPMPDGWTYTVAGNYGLGNVVSVHTPDCPSGFVKVAVPDVD